MEFLLRGMRTFSFIAVFVILALESQGGINVKASERSTDSLVTEIVTTGTIERVDELMVLKQCKDELYMTCVGDSGAQDRFLLFFINQEQKPTLLLILKVDSCAVENEDKLKHSLILKSYDSDLTNVEAIVRVNNKGCERYTSADKRMSPCECGDTQDRHAWTKLSIADSTSILKEIRSAFGTGCNGFPKYKETTLQSSVIADPTGFKMTEKLEIAGKIATYLRFKETPSAINVRYRRRVGKVIIEIIAIPVCIVAFIIMAAVLIPCGMLAGMGVGAAVAANYAAEVIGKIMDKINR